MLTLLTGQVAGDVRRQQAIRPSGPVMLSLAA